MRRSLHSIVLTTFVAIGTGCSGAKPPTPLTRAAFEGRAVDVIAALDRADGHACDALAWAARGGQPAPIVAITSRGVNPDACRVGVNGWTPLMHAIHKDQPAAVEALLKAGADANLAAARGFTPLMMATGNGNLTIVELLLAAGANPAATMGNGTSALSIAVSGGAFTDIERPLLGACRLEIVRALVARAPDQKLPPTFRWKLARALAHVNGCGAALRLASR